MSDELEYDDPAFQLGVAPVEEPTYEQRRKRKRDKINPTKKSEHAVRQLALSTSILPESGTTSKAMDIMKKMGFSIGDSLGQSQTTPASTEPLAFEIRSRGTGIGIPPLHKKAKTIDPKLQKNATATLKMDLSTYIARSKDGVNDKKVSGQLKSARRTAAELDRRNDIDVDSIKGGWRWKEHPDDIGVREREMINRKERVRKAGIRSGYHDEDDSAEPTRPHGKGKSTDTLEYASGLSAFVVEEQASDEENEAKKAVVPSPCELEVDVDSIEFDAWFSPEVCLASYMGMHTRRLTFFCTSRLFGSLPRCTICARRTRTLSFSSFELSQTLTVAVAKVLFLVWCTVPERDRYGRKLSW